ncbi:MAG: PTS fructose transporter subunit IIA [Lachnospiraceae bacterium]|nr:PTS fructose transporter subunit IIA [Lachnospiraceae bacterium]
MGTVIIISGHGSYASGISGFVRMVAGEIKGVEYIDFSENLTVEDLQGEFQKMLKCYGGEKILFLCDIVGGTPFNEAVKCAACRIDTEVVAGGNPASILEACFMKDSLEMQELINGIIENTKNSVVQFDFEAVKESADEEMEPGNGI